MSEFNGSFLGVRESSSATPEFVEEYAVSRANEKSIGADTDQFFIVFNSKANTFGLAFSDGLKDSLGFDKSYYYLVSEKDEINSNAEVYPAIDLFPNETERTQWLSDFTDSITNLISTNKTLFTEQLEQSASEIVESRLASIDLTGELASIKNATTAAKSAITQHLNIKLEEITLTENEKIESLESEIEELKEEIKLLKLVETGLTLDEVKAEIENSSSATNAGGLTEDQVLILINEKLSTFTTDTSDPAMIDDEALV